MQERIQDVPIWQKNQKILPVVPTVANQDNPIGCVPPAANIKTVPSMRAKQAKNISNIIGIDLMGSDNAPHLLLHAIFDLALKELPDCSFLLIGTAAVQKEFEILLERFSTLKKRLFFEEAEDAILMEEHPLHALRRKKNSSLSVGFKLLKEGKIEGLVSAGNTGALIAAAKMYLRMLPGIKRPALLALVPTRTKPVAVLDLGANVSCKAENFVQFAQMGIAFQKIRGIENPKVGLLNIGSEALKGTSEHRLAYQMLQQMKPKKFLFLGNIEAKEAFKGEADVLITDGFTGNIFLKTAEGIVSLIIDRLRDNVSEKEFTALGRHLDDLQRHLHYAEYPGALLAGVNGIVVKCHGYSTPRAIMNGIKGAFKLVKENFLSSLSSSL